MGQHETWVMRLTAQGDARAVEVQGHETAREVLGHGVHAVAVPGCEAAQSPGAEALGHEAEHK
eukprot:8035405-Alexandrium_andersonii.AAC.1